MSELFRSALGFALGSAGVGQSQAQGQNNGASYNSTSGGDEGGGGVVGEIITVGARRVKVTKLIAEGGFSYVFKGVDVSSGELLAIKKILAPDEESKSGVAQEKEYMGQFSNPNIAKYFGDAVGRRGKLEEHYLLMEYCPVVLPQPPLRLQQTAQVFAQSCRAIKYLHEFGIVHRDIKLENILIGSDGLVKLVDFGSATMEKYYPSPDWSMARRTIVEEQIAAKTTPMYRAPEMLDLWSNYPIDERADLWALGCLLFALNFGSHPFQDSNKLAITNANYSLPKNVSDSGPIVSLIRGLLQVDPASRSSFGVIFDVLQSIAESGGFSLGGPLPFKAPASPEMSHIVPPSSSISSSSGGIVNPMSSAGGGSSSLFSSLKGGAASLIKNIKEQSQQYLANPAQGQGQGLIQGQGQGQPPARPPQPQSQTHAQPSRPPPPRPPPSPIMSARKPSAASEQLEFENREYALLNHPPAKPPPPTLSTKGPPGRPPSPRMPSGPAPTPKIANLLDMSFDTPPPSQGQGPASNSDLLEDLFGSAPSQNNQDLFWQASAPAPTPTPQQQDEFDLLGDPLASLLGKSLPSAQQGLSAPSMPSSASFQNLNSNGRSEDLLNVGAVKIPKNSSSPNLLSDLILDEVIGGLKISSGGNSNPSLAATQQSQPQAAGNSTQGQSRPNYNRNLFEPPVAEKKTNLNDVFGDILSSQGFAGSGGPGGQRTINELRRAELASAPNSNPTQLKVNDWREGKKKNIRALLSSLHTIVWDGCSWEETNMSAMITPPQVKKVYRKACLAIHPDKQMGEEWEELAKMIFVELNEAWAAFEETQQ